MTTATDTATTTDPFRQSAEDYGRSDLDCPPGVFKIRLLGNLGKGEEQSGAKFINLHLAAEVEANYDPTTGIVSGETELRVAHRFFKKFYVGKRDGTQNEFAIKQLNSWLHAVGYSTKGEFNPATKIYDFDMDAALATTVDKSAWTRITHKENTKVDEASSYRWQIELDDFDKKPRYRIRVNGATT